MVNFRTLTITFKQFTMKNLLFYPILIFTFFTNHSFSQKKMTSFDPEKHGFNFSNTFDNLGYYVGASINLKGLCGGMSYSALDYFYYGIPVPQSAKTPNEGTDLTRYIRQRQWDTYSAQADKWIELFFNPFGWRTMEFWNWGIQGFNGGRLEELKNKIDNGEPVPLGLFAAGDAGFTSKHHQVVAIGYDMNGYDGKLNMNKENLKIFVYDPNYPNQTKTLRPNFDSTNPRYYYAEEPNKKWLTYFVDNNYIKSTPLDPAIINGCKNKNIMGLNLSGKNISNKNYRCSKGKGVNLRGATINGTDFYRSELDKGDFYGVKSNGVNFEKSHLSDANFDGADLKNSTFNEAILVNTRFYGADLKNVKMHNATADKANFEGADLHHGKFDGTSFRNARLYGTSLNTIQCKDCDFSGANLDRADLRGSDLSGSKFEGAIITKNTLRDLNTKGLPKKGI